MEIFFLSFLGTSNNTTAHPPPHASCIPKLGPKRHHQTQNRATQHRASTWKVPSASPVEVSKNQNPVEWSNPCPCWFCGRYLTYSLSFPVVKEEHHFHFQFCFLFSSQFPPETPNITMFQPYFQPCKHIIPCKHQPIFQPYSRGQSSKYWWIFPPLR